MVNLLQERPAGRSCFYIHEVSPIFLSIAPGSRSYLGCAAGEAAFLSTGQPRLHRPVETAAPGLRHAKHSHWRTLRADCESLPPSGFGVWWLALAVAAMVPEEMHWVMTGELTFPGKWYVFLGRPFSRWQLKRLANIYGFTSMPPMPPRKKDVTARARSVRARLEYVRLHPGSMLALATEGRDDLNGVLA
jgi:hypothetical protein